jgi:hypothetical protein
MLSRKVFTYGFPQGLLTATLAVALLAGILAVSPGVAFAVGPYPNSVTYSGQGLIADGFGGYDLQTEICGIANGADADGPYLLWVLTAPSANNADITGPWGTATMTQSGGGAYKYISAWYSPSTLPGNVVATYDGRARNAQLVISHGCRPFTHGAWCSPGFWRNATDAAWELTGFERNTDLFNITVFDYWYGATFVADPTLQTVLNNPPTYSGPPLAGTSGYALNAFNATGAMLTDAIPGFDFSWDAMQLNNDSQTCPIDHFGNFK